MTKEQLQAILDSLPPGTEIFTRSGDNAWPTVVRVFHDRGTNGITVFMDYKAGEHRNFPEGYSGATEIKL